jgi:hypothetical protein
MTPVLLLIIVISCIALFYLRRKTRIAIQAEYIRSFKLPSGLYAKLRHKRPELTLKDCELVGHALRQFFLAYLKSGCKFIAMPSQLADDLWHEFILYTKQYQLFCKQAFGGFLHHSPAAVLSNNKNSNVGLRRAWWFACKEENINPRTAFRLPLLFALDAKLNIADGFRYQANCKKLNPRHDNSIPIYCGGDFSNPIFDGSTDGFGGDNLFDGIHSHSDSSDNGCGGGCGGGD